MKNAFIFKYVGLLIAFVGSLFFYLNRSIFVSRGYELAIDGYLISRTLVILFWLYLIVKLFNYISEDKKIKNIER
ncbi:hypothetical protein ACYRFS_07850 [Listeria kieliensis]